MKQLGNGTYLIQRDMKNNKFINLPLLKFGNMSNIYNDRTKYILNIYSAKKNYSRIGEFYEYKNEIIMYVKD